MFESDLQQRRQKFELESKRRSAEQKVKLQKLLKEKEAARKLEQRAHEEAKVKRLAAEAAREAEESRQDSLREGNRGIFLERQLVAEAIPDTVASDKGIKRSVDKILLPPSMGRDLMAQGVSKNGAILFEVTTVAGRSTHAGLLEFTSEENVVGLPKKVVQSLWGPEGNCHGTVSVAYKRLDPGKYARFQPVRYGFHEAVGDNMREVLEATLMKHCTLTQGDYLELEYNGTIHELKVVEIDPPPAVSVIDTDLEVDVTPSEEVEAAVRAEQEAVRLRQEEMDRIMEQKMAMENEQMRQTHLKLEKEARRNEMRAQIAIEKERLLPPEVQDDWPGMKVVCMIRWPDGSRHQRRFKHEDPVSQIFDFVDSKGVQASFPGAYRLVSQFPRRVIESSSTSTIADIGLTDSQEVLFVEPDPAAASEN